MNANSQLKLTDAIQVLEQVVQSVPMAEIPNLLGLLEKAKALSWSRMLTEKQNSDEERLLTVPEVATRLKISDDRAYELVRDGDIKATRLGKPEQKRKRVRVRIADLELYVAQQRA